MFPPELCLPAWAAVHSGHTKFHYDIFGQSNDVCFKVGLLTTMGLTAKSAILIAEFARDLRAQ